MRPRARVEKDAIPLCPVASHLGVRYLRQILQGHADIALFSERELLHHKPEARSAVFVIDIEWKSHSLSSYLRSVKSVMPDARVLLLGEEPTPEELCGLLFLGIDGFVAYADLQRNELLSAVYAVAQGHPWIDPRVLGLFLTRSRKPGERDRSKRVFVAGHEGGLTEREKLVFGLLERRLSNKEISSALGISEGTVKFHVSNILAKRGMRDRHSVAELSPPSSEHSAAQDWILDLRADKAG